MTKSTQHFEYDFETVFDYVCFLRPYIPVGDTGVPATNSEIRRWFDRKAVVINGDTPGWRDPVTFPITDLVFFPNGKRKTTLV